MAHLQFRNRGQLVGDPEDHFAHLGRIALHALHIAVADKQAEAAGEGVVDDGWVRRDLAQLDQLLRVRRCIAESVPQRHVDRVVLDVEVQEHQLQRVGQPVVGGRRARPHRVCAERHFVRLQDGHDVRVPAGRDVVMPDVGRGLGLVGLVFLDHQYFGVPLVRQCPAERMPFQFLAEIQRDPLLLLERQVLVAREQHAVLPQCFAQFSG